MKLQFTLLCSLLVLAACSQREINVDYTPGTGTGARADWYPIPVEQTRSVTSAERSVERPPVTIDDSLFESSASTRLEITESTDSFGNVSLEVNRSASLTWELLEEAVEQLGWPVEDRDRSRYRLELADADVARRSFFGRVAAFFSGERQRVFLILVPRVGSTGVSAEYPDDEVLSADDNRLLMADIRNALLDGSAQGRSRSTDQE